MRGTSVAPFRTVEARPDEGRVRSRAVVLAAALSLLPSVGALGGGPVGAGDPPRPWYGSGQDARRKIRLPGGVERGDPALLRLGTAGLSREDGRDIQIVVAHRQAVPVEILEVGPGDTALLWFPVVDPSLELHAYFGRGTAAPVRRPSRRLARGLVLDVRELPDGTCESWDEARDRLRSAERRIGIALPRSIALGLPPFGARRYLARYNGYLRVSKPGVHRFETVSDGASFVLVDEQLTASWPGYHGTRGRSDPEARAEHTGEVRLTPGLHSIEYVVATPTGGVHLLGWAEPGDERVRPLTARHLVEWAVAGAGKLEHRAGTRTADFHWEIASDANSDAERHDLAEVTFRFDGDPAGRPIQRVRWDFADGQRGEGERTSHVYLRHGTFPVRMEATFSDGETLQAAREVVVRFESFERVDLDSLLARYHSSTTGYDLETLPADHLRQLVWLRKMDERWEPDLWRAVEAWFRRDLAIPDGDIARLGRRRAVELLREAPRGTLATAMLRKLAEGAPAKDDREEALAWLSWVRARGKEPAEARSGEAALDRLYRGGARGRPRRRAGLLLARLYLERGKGREAGEILERLDRSEEFRAYTGLRQIASNSRRLRVDNLLGEGRTAEARDELDQWEWELPGDLASGVLQLAWARWYRAAGREDEALRELATLRDLDSAERTRPRALLLEAELLEAAGRAAEARARLETAAREHAGRPEGREAALRLEKKPPGSRGR